MSAEGRSLDVMLAELPRSVSTAELIIPVAEKRKFELMSRISEKMEPQGARLTRIDGVRAEFPDGWGLVPALLVPLWLGRRLGGHSGDSYGASVEWAETLALLLSGLGLRLAA